MKAVQSGQNGPLVPAIPIADFNPRLTDHMLTAALLANRNPWLIGLRHANANDNIPVAEKNPASDRSVLRVVSESEAFGCERSPDAARRIQMSR